MTSGEALYLHVSRLERGTLQETKTPSNDYDERDARAHAPRGNPEDVQVRKEFYS